MSRDRSIYGDHEAPKGTNKCIMLQTIIDGTKKDIGNKGCKCRLDVSTYI